jgi:hypothetical protein
VVLAVSDEGDDLVAPYVDQNGVGVRVASGSGANKAFGVAAYPSAVLIDPEGKIAWTGHPSSLTKGTVEKALKGAKARALDEFMAMSFDREFDRKLASAVKSAEAGKLGKALTAASRVAANEKLTPAQREEAVALAGEIEAHARLLSEQAEAFLARRDVLTAIMVLGTLSKELKGTEAGNALAARLDEISKDPAIMKEVDAAEAFEKARSLSAKRGAKKAVKKYEAIVKKYPGTRAAERAAMILREL